MVHTYHLDELVPVGDGKAERGDDRGVGLLDGLPRPIGLVLAACDAELAPEGEVVVTIVLRLDGAAAAHDRVGGAVVRDDDRTLERACSREHVVGEQGGRGHPVIDGHQELALLEGGEGHLRVAVGVHRVGGVADEGADLIRIAREDGLEHRRAVSLAEPLGGQRLAPRALRVVGDELVAGPGGQLILVGADLLALLLLGKTLVELELLVGEEVERGTGHAVAARERRGCRKRRAATRAHGSRWSKRDRSGPSAAPLDAAGLVHGVHASRGADLVGLEPGDGGGPLRRVLGDVLHELVEALAPLADELVVGQALVDDGVQKRQRESGIGPGRSGSHRSAFEAVSGNADRPR